jgi:glycosyltransferase involved in cell wall biosynthesis
MKILRIYTKLPPLKGGMEKYTPRVKLHQKSSLEIINQYNISDDKLILLFIGRLVVFKGLKYLLQALSHIDKNIYHLLIVGDGELKSELQKLSEDLNIKSNTTFVGSVSFNTVPYFMSSCDIFVLPSLDEGFGRVILEAMAMKKIE